MKADLIKSLLKQLAYQYAENTPSIGVLLIDENVLVIITTITALDIIHFFPFPK